MDFYPFHNTLSSLRGNGWRVAVHNDYRLNGTEMTFWLMTHQDGRYFKGEGATDLEALLHIERQIEQAGDAVGNARPSGALSQADDSAGSKTGGGE